ncbi:hypothetical protein Tco_0085868 [Tanacetum coccineum]
MKVLISLRCSFLTTPKFRNCKQLRIYKEMRYCIMMLRWSFIESIFFHIPNDFKFRGCLHFGKDNVEKELNSYEGTIHNKLIEKLILQQFDHLLLTREAPVFHLQSFAQLMNDLERNESMFPNLDTFDDLFDCLQHFEKLVNVSRAIKLKKSHDPLALVAHTGSSSRNTSSYYVTHPISVVDYEDEYQQDDVHTNPEDPLTSAMLFKEIEELSANICLMARIQPADNTSDAGPSYDSAFISEVQSSSNTENEEQMYPTHTKIINSTIGDDQIDSDIIFDSPNRNVNSGSIEKDTHVPDLCALEQLARNAYQEAKKQQIFAQKVQKQNTTLTSQLELYKERVSVRKHKTQDNNISTNFLEADKRAKHLSQQAQSQFIRDRDIIRDLENNEIN